MRRTILSTIALTFLIPNPIWARNITVQPGETLSEIAAKHQVPIKDLVLTNQISNSNKIEAGRTLKIPENKQRIDLKNLSQHKVKRGETLTNIANIYKISQAELISLNQIKNSNYLYYGQTLKLPQNAVVPNNGMTQGTAITTSNSSYHVVKKGQTLTQVSKAYKIPIEKIIQINEIKNPNNLPAGKKLLLKEKTNSTPKNLISNNNNSNPSKSLFRSYGPLQIDWSKWHLMGGSYVTPTLNKEGQALYLAVNCSVKKINATGANGSWKQWSQPVHKFEKDLLKDLCKAKGS